jgi:hypothetical protein
LHSVGQAVLLRLGGFILRYFYGGFILNLAAVLPGATDRGPQAGPPPSLGWQGVETGVWTADKQPVALLANK